MKAKSIPTLLLLLASGTLAGTAPAAAQPPLTRAEVTSQPQSSGLEPSLRQAAGRGGQPLWVGYSVPMVAGLGTVCCHEGLDDKPDNGLCELEDRDHGWSTDRAHARAEQSLNVLVRFAGGKPTEVRAVSADCRLDGGGRPFVWLGAAKPEESVAYLAGLAHQAPDEPRGFGEAALAVLALHRNSGADTALEAMAAPASPFKLRQSSLFWLGQLRGERGARYLAGVIRNDRDDEKIQDHAVFSLSQSKVPWADETILETAKTHRSAHVRGQALFWLVQMEAPGAKGAVLQAIEKESDPKVRGQAVFALSQLKGGQAVPALVDLVHASRNAAVRKEALFWLAQSKDPAATSYLDKVLND